MNGNPKRPRILLAEEGIRDHGGHWLVYNCSIANGFRDLGWEVQIAGSRQLAPEVASGGIRPVFSESRWSPEFDRLSPLRRKLWNLRHNVVLARDMGRFMDREEPFDILFAGNVTLAHAYGWWRVLKRHPAKVQRLVLMFVQDAGHYAEGASEPTFPAQARLLRFFLRRFKPLIDHGKVFFTAETEVTQRQYARLTGLPVHLLHHPVELPPGRQIPDDLEAPLLVAPGFARYEKGSDLLQSAWLQFRRQHPDVPARLHMQWGGGFTLPDGTVEDLRLGGLPDVTVQRDPLNEMQLADLLHSASGAILPYRRSSYYSRLSRVAIEAMQAGLPILHTADTWLASAVTAHGAGMAVPSDDPAALAEALPRFIEQLPVLRRVALARRTAAVQAFSAGAFARKMVQLRGTKTP